MTKEEYYATVRKRLGLNPTNVPHVYRNSAGDIYNVPNADEYTPEQLDEIIERLKHLLGISPRKEEN
jgi:hypothetical protein